MRSKMEPPAFPNPKKLITKTLKKHPKSSTPKSRVVVRFLSQNGNTFSWRNAPKITSNPKIVKMGPRASKRCPRAPKMTENNDFCRSKYRTFHCKNDPKIKKISKHEANKKARWRACAQRTGYYYIVII